MSAATHYTPEQTKEDRDKAIAELHTDGLSKEFLAEWYGISPVRVYQILKEQGVLKRQRKSWNRNDPNSVKWKRPEMIDHLWYLHDRLGRVPRSKDLRDADYGPQEWDYKQGFGTWNQALKAAGMEINKLGNGQGRGDR